MKPTPRFLLTALSVLALPAAAATGWLYDPGTKTLTETGVAEGATPWVLSCSASGTSLTLSGVSSAGSDGFLDLSLPVADAGGTPFSIVATGSDAFKNRTEIRRLRFADSTTSIGTRSFQDCAYLESVELPAALSSIETRGFYGCVRLRTVEPFLPATVSTVGESAFQNCTRLASPLSVGFGTSGGTPVAATMSGRVFQDCKALPSVAVGPGVVKLADNLFVGDTSLTNVVLHDAITSIGSSFNGCTALETVTPLLPASVVAVSAYAFQHCYALSGDLFVATNGAAATIGGAAFYNARGLTSATMGDGVAKIDGNTFCGCSSLTRVRLSANLTSIGSSAFNGCSALESVEPFLPPNATSIGENAFTGCTSLRGDLSVAANGGAATIGASAFSNNRGISSVSLGEGVTKIDGNAFNGCASLTNAVLSPSLATIGQAAFSGCSALESVEPFLPASVAGIGQNAFSGCTRLAGDLVLDPPAALSIPAGAFYNAQAISSVSLGTNVTAVGDNTFQGLSNVRTFRLARKPTWKSNSFGGFPNNAVRFIVPIDDADWTDWISNAANATPWDGLSDAQRAAYAAAYPNEPPARALTKAAPANQWVVSYGSATAGAVDLFVAGDPVQAAAASVSPAYGAYADVSASLPLSLSAPQYANEPDGRYVCSGYRIEPADTLGWGAATDYALADPTAPSATFDPATAGQFRLSWLWEPAEYALVVADAPAASIGTVSIAGRNAHGFFDPGATATATAVPGAGVTFLRWLGDVPAGHETDATIQIVMDASKTLTPVFSANWVYSSGQLTDGYWTLQVSGSLGAITITKPLVNSPLGLLDLAKPVEGDGAIVAIANNAFKDSTALRELTLPDTLKTIGSTVFSGCQALGGDVVVPDSVTSIGVQAFQSCSSLKTVRLGAGITSVPGNCFQYDSSLERVEMGDGVASIGNYAFRDCSSLVSISPLLPAATASLGSAAFSGCGKLAGEVFFATNGAAASFAGGQAFYNCKAVTGAAIGAGVTEIPAQTFSGCAALRRVRTGDGVTTVGQQAFQNCTSLETVEPFLAPALVSLGNQAFNNCSRLGGTLEIGTRKRPGAVSIASHSNFYNAGIEEAVIGRGVVSLPKQFLYWDRTTSFSRLRSITLDSVESIGEKAFAAAKAVSDVWFKGPAPTTYGANVYQGWSEGQSVLHLPKGEETWQDWAAENVTPWDDLTDDQRELFWDREPGRKAYGMTTSSATPAKQFVVWWNARNMPTVLIVK